jgi:hypothetical protein
VATVTANDGFSPTTGCCITAPIITPSFRPVEVYGLDAAQAQPAETTAVTKGKPY